MTLLVSRDRLAQDGDAVARRVLVRARRDRVAGGREHGRRPVGVGEALAEVDRAGPDRERGHRGEDRRRDAVEAVGGVHGQAWVANQASRSSTLALRGEADPWVGRLVGVGLRPGQGVADDVGERAVGQPGGLGTRRTHGQRELGTALGPQRQLRPVHALLDQPVAVHLDQVGVAAEGGDGLLDHRRERRGRTSGREGPAHAVLRQAHGPRPHVAGVDALHRGPGRAGQQHRPAAGRAQDPPRVPSGRVARAHDVRRADQREAGVAVRLAGGLLARDLERTVGLVGDLVDVVGRLVEESASPRRHRRGPAPRRPTRWRRTGGDRRGHRARRAGAGPDRAGRRTRRWWRPTKRRPAPTGRRCGRPAGGWRRAARRSGCDAAESRRVRRRVLPGPCRARRNGCHR